MSYEDVTPSLFFSFDLAVALVLSIRLFNLLEERGNLIPLLMVLPARSFILTDDLALVTESRGFDGRGRSSRKQYHLTIGEYGLMITARTALAVFHWWGWE